MMVSEKWNGGGMDSISYAIAMEEISRIDGTKTEYTFEYVSLCKLEYLPSATYAASCSSRTRLVLRGRRHRTLFALSIEMVPK